jgi:putative intracellular protease/amidase
MQIAYVVYPDFTGLDLVGPYEVISRWPAADVHFIASSPEPVRADRGLTVIPTDTPDTMPQPDLVVVPGSQNPVPVLSDEVLIGWLRDVAPGCQWTASVCTGAGLYAAAGLLQGKKTTTHWGFRDNLGNGRRGGRGPRRVAGHPHQRSGRLGRHRHGTTRRAAPRRPKLKTHGAARTAQSVWRPDLISGACGSTTRPSRYVAAGPSGRSRTWRPLGRR